MNLLDLQIKISTDMEDAIDDLEALDEKAGSSGKGFGSLETIAVATGTIIADAIEGMISKLGEFVEASITASIDFESSMAKVQTIMNPDELGVPEMSNAIMDLSNQMGISTTDIANSVYDVISATGDTANAVNLVEQATKLATGGFADTGDAVSVLTTAINAYGLELDDAQHISDSLITVQNLGVTTVGDLASAMGKAIATGSAYGVDLENLETGYIALTKAGIGTAEATTYMSGMINELGKSGTDVSNILEEQTGKSFGQLMGEGKSLGYVLNILMKSVDNDTEAFANLWGSAEAGKSASAIVGQGLSEFDSWLLQVRDSSGATETAFSTMSETTEHKIDVLKNSLKNIGTEALTPLLDDASAGLDELIALVDSIDLEEIKNSLIEAEPLIIAVGSAIGVVTAGITAYNIVQGIKLAMDTAEVSTLPALISLKLASASATLMAVAPYILVAGAIAGVIAIIVLCIKHWDEIKAKVTEVAGAIKDTVKSKFDAVKTTVSDVMNGIKDKITSTWDGIKEKIRGAIDTIKGMMNFSWKLPDLKLPHFTVTGGKAPWGFMGQGSLPSVSVSWYAKAMENPLLLNGATIFGSAGDRLLGGGEAGAEIVVGQDKLMSMIAEASGQNNERILNAIYNELHMMNAGMYDTITSALNGMGVDYNERELARLVKKYA